MKAFEDCLEGFFSNKYQAMKDPTKFAHINIKHVRIGDDLFYGEQAYNYSPKNPYRQFVLKIVPTEGDYIVQNYEVPDPTNHIGCKNLDVLTKNVLRQRVGCDTMFTLENEIYKGFLPGKNCIVPWRGRQTYLQNQIELGEDFYWVQDTGLDVNNQNQVWGSRWGYLKFYKFPAII